MRCYLCGREGHGEYAQDGQYYCSSCLFYGMNKQCNRCRMYLPTTEMQMYRGQLHCQYCIMDLRDEEKRTEPGKKDDYLENRTIHETCERCGRVLTTAYFYNGKRLCGSCLESERSEWDRKGGEMPPTMMYRVSEERGVLSSIVHFIVGKIAEFLGLKKKEYGKVEIVPVEKRRVARKKRKETPMAESLRKTVKGDTPFSKKSSTEGPRGKK